MNKIKRYDVYAEVCQNLAFEIEHEFDDGEYIKYDDIKPLLDLYEEYVKDWNDPEMSEEKRNGYLVDSFYTMMNEMKDINS